MHHKYQRGFVSWIVILCLLVLALAFYMIEDSARDQTVNRLRSKPPVLTAEQVKVIDDYKAKPTPVKSLSGLYRGTLKSEGRSLEIRYYFGSDDMLTKSVNIEDNSFNGSAKYSIKGSTLAFTDIEGDKGLFSPQGEAFTVDGDKLTFPGSDIAFTLAKEPE